MKKPLLILLYLIGLSTFNQVSAQHDLDLRSHPSVTCDINVSAGETDPSCAPGISLTTLLPAGASLFTVTYTGSPYVVNKFYVTDCAGNGAMLYDYTMCGFGLVSTVTLPPSACCPTGVTVIFTPATPTANALISVL